MFTQQVLFKNGKYHIDYRCRLSRRIEIAHFEDIDQAKKFVRENLPHYTQCNFPDGSSVTGTQNGFGAWT